jgi:aspartyl protease family protein
MGHVRVRVRFARPERRQDGIEVADAVVDTGATWTVVPRELAENLSLDVFGGKTVKTAEGLQTLRQSYAYIEMADKEMVTHLLVSDTLDTTLIGVTTLEAMGLMVDPTKEELRDAEVFLLRIVCLPSA